MRTASTPNQRRTSEGLIGLQGSYYTYDRPETTFDASGRLLPWPERMGRHRLQINAAVRRELWKDFFVALNLYDTFDSVPPNPDAARNDVRVVISIGWSY
jgi:hypothetical protein